MKSEVQGGYGRRRAPFKWHNLAFILLLAPGLTPEPEAFANALLAVVRKHGMVQHVTVQGFDWRSLQAMRALAPEIPIAALTVRQSFLNNLTDPRWAVGLKLADHGGSVPRLVKALGAAVWSPHHLGLAPQPPPRGRAREAGHSFAA